MESGEEGTKEGETEEPCQTQFTWSAPEKVRGAVKGTEVAKVGGLVWTRRAEGGVGRQRQVNMRRDAAGRMWLAWVVEKGGVFSRLVYFMGYIGAGKEGKCGEAGARPSMQGV